MPQSADVGILEAALVGYRYKIKELEERIATLRGKSDGARRQPTESQAQPVTKKKRSVSAAGRKRMVEAQRKRWADVKAKQKS